MMVYEFIFSDNTWESSAATISVHRTRKGAEMALDFHKNKEYEEYLEIWITPPEREGYPFGESQYWGIRETELKD